jgi:hypothetical protein
MTYAEALKEANKVGTSKAEGLLLLALTVKALALAHAISPRLVFEGAVRKGLSANEVRKLDPVSLGNLMFA